MTKEEFELKVKEETGWKVNGQEADKLLKKNGYSLAEVEGLNFEFQDPISGDVIDKENYSTAEWETYISGIPENAVVCFLTKHKAIDVLESVGYSYTYCSLFDGEFKGYSSAINKTMQKVCDDLFDAKLKELDTTMRGLLTPQKIEKTFKKLQSFSLQIKKLKGLIKGYVEACPSKKAKVFKPLVTSFTAETDWQLCRNSYFAVIKPQKEGFRWAPLISIFDDPNCHLAFVWETGKWFPHKHTATFDHTTETVSGDVADILIIVPDEGQPSVVYESTDTNPDLSGTFRPGDWDKRRFSPDNKTGDATQRLSDAALEREELLKFLNNALQGYYSEMEAYLDLLEEVAREVAKDK